MLSSRIKSFPGAFQKEENLMKKHFLRQFVLGAALVAAFLIPDVYAQNRQAPDQELITKRNQIEKELQESPSLTAK